MKHIVKAAPSNYTELKFKLLFGYGLYLGLLCWNIGPATDIDGNPVELGRQLRWHKRFSLHKLERTQGMSFWDVRYW